MLRLEASRSGGIDIIDVLGRKRLDETNTKMYAIQALANASRSGTWDEQTLIALENSLFSQGRIYNNDPHTLSAADIDALITYEDGILFREFGNWLEGGGGLIVQGLSIIGTATLVNAINGVYSSGNGTARYINGLGTKDDRYIAKRGWTIDSINDVYSNPYATREAYNKANGNPATVYYTKAGAYAVIDDITGQLVQVSKIGDIYWQPDSTTAYPYNPFDFANVIYGIKTDD